VRESLETRDEVRAELLRATIELQAALLEPRYTSEEIPARIGECLLRMGAAVMIYAGLRRAETLWLGRWTADNFAKKLLLANRAASLKWVQRQPR
jgi:hypothetical protein